MVRERHMIQLYTKAYPKLKMTKKNLTNLLKKDGGLGVDFEVVHISKDKEYTNIFIEFIFPD